MLSSLPFRKEEDVARAAKTLPIRLPQSEPIQKGYAILPVKSISSDHKVVAYCKTKRTAFDAFLRAVNGNLRESDLAGVKRYCVIEFSTRSEDGDTYFTR